jgi:hypothetical protein
VSEWASGGRSGELHGAIYRRDRATLLGLLASEARSDRLQLVGAGVLVALVDNGEPVEVARRLSAALRGRDWLGDEELAEEIDDALVGQDTGRRPVPVDLGELAAPLQDGPSGGGLLDLTTGEIWPSELFDDPYLNVADLELPDVDEDPDRWLELPIPTSRDGWRDMRDFAEGLRQPAQQRLLNAIDGPGAFARFRREVDRAGEDLRDQWLEFREERRLGRARAWLAAEGYTVSVTSR